MAFFTLYNLRKYLELSSKIINKIPSKKDSTVTKTVKSISILDSVIEILMPSKGSIDEFTSQYNLERKTNRQFVSLFFDSVYDDKSMKKRNIQLDKNRAITEILIPKIGKLYFLNTKFYFDVKSRQEPHFWHSANFDFKTLLSVLWAKHDNRLTAILKQERERGFTIIPIGDCPNPIFGKAGVLLEDIKDKEKQYSLDNEPRTYLLIGEPGTGKSTWAEKLCPKNQRLLKVSSEICNRVDLDSLLFLFDSLEPDYIIIDDVDRITTLSYSVSFLLNFLETLKKSHPNISLLMTANYPKNLDKAVLRPGRVDEIIEFPVQDKEEREAILSGYFNYYDLDIKKDILDKLVDVTEGLTSAYLREIALQFKYCDAELVFDRVSHMQKFKKKLEKEEKEDKKSKEDKKAKAVKVN